MILILRNSRQLLYFVFQVCIVMLGVIVIQTYLGNITSCPYKRNRRNICLGQIDIFNKYLFCNILQNPMICIMFIFLLNLLLTYLFFVLTDKFIKEQLKHTINKPTSLKNNTSFMSCPLGFGKIDRGCKFIDESLLNFEGEMIDTFKRARECRREEKLKRNNYTNEANINKEVKPQPKSDNNANGNTEKKKEGLDKLLENGFKLINDKFGIDMNEFSDGNNNELFNNIKKLFL